MEFINRYILNYINLPALDPNELQGFGHINKLSCLSIQHTSNNKIMQIMQCLVNTSNMVDHRTNRAVFGTSKLCLLSSNVDTSLDANYFLHLHNKLIQQFQRALKYSKRNIDVPISQDLKQLFLDPHKDEDEGDLGPPLKRARY